MKRISGLVPQVSIGFRATLTRTRRPYRVRLGDFTWTRSREMGETGWRVGKRSNATVNLWWRRPLANRADVTAAITGADPWTLKEWVYEVRIQPDALDRLTWPFSAGAVVRVQDLAEQTLELTYPVYASMQWVDAFGGGEGVYVGAHDSAPYFKHLRASVEKRGKRRVLLIEFVYTDLELPPEKEWHCPPLVVARHDGDWRSGADIYREWAETWLQRDPVPEYMRKAAGHNMASFPGGRGRVPFKDLSKLAKETRRLGIPGIHVADWMEEGFDTFYPAFKPDPRLGGHKQLCKAIQDMEGQAVWTCLYTNGRILDPAGPHGAHAFEWAVKLPPDVRRRFSEMWKRTQNPSFGGWDPGKVTPEKPSSFNQDGSAAEEWWGRPFAAVCPSVPGWQQLWLSRISDLSGTLRPRMFQVDQVCGCWGLPCYDTNHPHASPALAWSAYKAFTREMRQRAKEANPEVGLWTEGVNDILGQAFDGVQASLGFDSLLAGIGEWDFRIFRYTFPEFLLVSGDLNGKDLWRLGWMIILGAHYHFHIPDPSALTPESRRWVRFAARVRARYWKEFTSRDVFVPNIQGDSGVRVIGYRAGNHVLLAGAPLYPKPDVQRAFRIEMDPEVTGGSVLKSEWVCGKESGSVSLWKGRLAIRGKGPFLALLSRP